MAGIKRAAIYGGHAFRPGGDELVNRRGRRQRLCAECSKAENSPRHRSYAIPGPAPAKTPRITKTPAARPLKPRRALRVDRPPIRTEVRLLAAALDLVLQLPADDVGWRLRIRAGDCRAAIPEIPVETPPERPGSTETRETPEPTMSPPPPTLAPARVPGDLAARTIDRVPHGAVARAKSQARRIKDPKLREIAVRAIVDGYSFRISGNNHGVLRKGARTLGMPLGDTDPRSWRNQRAAAKRLGIDVEGI
jgi:hypothetical protein